MGWLLTAVETYSARLLRYARGVAAGQIPAGEFVRTACARHLSDLKASKSKDYPYKFSREAQDRICKFAENMLHTKGKWAGQLIHLEDWQVFILGAAFGWLRKADGLRRFREFYCEIPRKNGKSQLGAIIGLYLAFADGEPGAEVYAGATSEAQANMVFRPAWMMVKKNPEFQAHFKLGLSGTETNPGTIFQIHTGSRFETTIGKPGDGASPHGAIIDEYHEHQTPDQYNAMKTGMGSRTQPMRVIITTAGTDTSGPCYEKHEEAQKVLRGTLENDEMFSVIFGIDLGNDDEPGDDWTDIATARKANPNFGVSVFEDFIAGQIRDGMQSTSQQSEVLTKHFDVWLSAGNAWMNMLKWNECKDENLHLESFANARCWLGMDLASKIDIASLAYILEAPWGWAFFCKHYLPEDTIELSENVHYRKWRDDPRGWLTQTDGAITDFARIEDDIRDAAKMFSVQSLAYDNHEAGYLINNIQKTLSFPCVDVPQGPANISQPMKEMEAAIYAGQMKHNGDPVLTWMMGNVIKKASRTGGTTKAYYPTKQNPKSKIDGVVAGIIALSQFMVKAPPKKYQMIFVS